MGIPVVTVVVAAVDAIAGEALVAPPTVEVVSGVADTTE